MNLGNLLKKITDKLDSHDVDYVVEQGTSGIWTYRKWASGRKECWGRKVYTSTITGGWGNMFISVDEIYESYPFAFTNVPVCVAQVDANTNYSAWLISNSTGTDRRSQTPKYKLARPTSVAAQTYVIDFYASADA